MTFFASLSTNIRWVVTILLMVSIVEKELSSIIQTFDYRRSYLFSIITNKKTDCDENGNDITITTRLVGVMDCSNKKDWLAMICTNIELS